MAEQDEAKDPQVKKAQPAAKARAKRKPRTVAPAAEAPAPVAEDAGQTLAEEVDPERERNLKVTAMMEAGVHERLAAETVQGTTHDGLSGAPSHREGEVWESMAPEDDEAGGGRRRVRVQVVEGGEVTAVNLVTGVVSHFQAENLQPPKWRRAHS